MGIPSLHSMTMSNVLEQASNRNSIGNRHFSVQKRYSTGVEASQIQDNVTQPSVSLTTESPTDQSAHSSAEASKQLAVAEASVEPIVQAHTVRAQAWVPSWPAAGEFPELEFSDLERMKAADELFWGSPMRAKDREKAALLYASLRNCPDPSVKIHVKLYLAILTMAKIDLTVQEEQEMLDSLQEVRKSGTPVDKELAALALGEWAIIKCNYKLMHHYLDPLARNAIDPLHRVHAYRDLALSFFHRGRWEKLKILLDIADEQLALLSENDQSFVKILLGHYYLEMKNLIEADRIFQNVLLSVKNDSEVEYFAYVSLGDICLSNKQYVQAKVNFETALKLAQLNDSKKAKKYCTAKLKECDKVLAALEKKEKGRTSFLGCL